MTSTRTPEPSPDSGLDQALKSATAALGKTDVKVGALFAAEVGLAAMVRGALSEGPTAARVAAGCIAVAIVFTVLAFLPRLKDDGASSFPHWAELTPEEIREAVGEDVRPQQVRVQSRMAVIKFRHIQAAGIATGLAGLLLLAANALSAS
ncbi:Pycsar system effector family protein [Streptomyces sp. NPDC000405]|uniref:Pycsar system effector family protein n=1 Tax=Streptomyces sp. NPDC000405 TaxID=3161033 RepID=UPI00398CC5E9